MPAEFQQSQPSQPPLVECPPVLELASAKARPPTFTGGPTSELKWATVRTGLGLLLLGQILILFGIPIAFVGLYLLLDRSSWLGYSYSSSVTLVRLLAYGGLATAFLGGSLILTGTALGCTAPAPSKAGRWSMGALLGLLLQMVFGILSLAAGYDNEDVSAQWARFGGPSNPFGLRPE